MSAKMGCCCTRPVPLSRQRIERLYADGIVLLKSTAYTDPTAVICIDHRRVGWTRGTGVASYAHTLRRGVIDAGYAIETLVDAPLELFTPPGRAWRWMTAMAPWSVGTSRLTDDSHMAPDVFRRAQVHFDIYGSYLRLHAARPPALMHWTYPLPLHFAGAANVYSVLDVIPVLQPDLTPIDRARAQRLLYRLRHEAAHLVTISETSRRDIITALDWPADRVTNTSLAVEVADPDATLAKAECAAAGLGDGDYFLHVGTVERRKNIARLLAAYRTSGSTRPLVLAGPDGWGAAGELAGVSDLIVPSGQATWAACGRPRVVRIGWMERPALLALMSRATALLAPSLAEGFGLPTIEAMALGTPVLTSSNGAPLEVAGDAALVVDPLDIRTIAAGITALDRDPALRARLAAAGRLRAQAFTPAAYATRVARVYEAVLDRRRTSP